MIGDTLTKENLLSIKIAMDKIKEIDRSEAFSMYYEEIISRLKEFKN